MNEWQCAEQSKLFCWWYKQYLNTNLDIYTDTNTSFDYDSKPMYIYYCNVVQRIMPYGMLLMVFAQLIE